MIFSSSGPAPADDTQVGDFIRFAGHRGIQLAELQLLVDRPAGGAADAAGERLLWAVLPIYNPGRTMLLLGASAVTASGAGAGGAMRAGVESLCRSGATRGVQLAQVLLDPADRTTIDLYEPAGFRIMAELIYLHRTLRRAPPPAAPAPAGFTLESYSQANHTRFAAGILASYVDSQDCPALNGIRNIDDVIAGHKASGDFDPSDWLLISHDGEPAGVLLLNRSGQMGGMELVYLGLAPAVRRKGFGQWAMSLALARVWQHKLSSLTLAVDAGNAQALRLYHRFGMQRVMSKLALMRELKLE
jgi:mycothiol synthase